MSPSNADKRREENDKRYDALIASLREEATKKDEDVIDEKPETKAPWYRRFLARRLLANIRRHLIIKHELKSRKDAVKLVLALEELFDIPRLDRPDESYTRAEIEELTAKELGKVLEQATLDLEEQV